MNLDMDGVSFEDDIDSQFRDRFGSADALECVFRDIGVARPLLLQIWRFATPVVYPLASIPGRFRTLCLANPVAGLVDSFRRVVLEATLPDAFLLTYSTLFAVAFFAVAYIIFKVLDANMADVL